MPRTARVVAVAAPHHVTQRGNNRQQTFFSDAQRRYYLALLAEQSRLHELRILGYCVMRNHVHLVVVPGRQDSLAKGIGRSSITYSRYLNQVAGSHALRYVDLNPVCAGLVERATDCPWSRAQAHVLGEDRAGLLDREVEGRDRAIGAWRRQLRDLAGLNPGRDRPPDGPHCTPVLSRNPSMFRHTMRRALPGFRVVFRGP